MRLDENVNVLVWWKKNLDAYPILLLMASDFLAIHVGKISLELTFSGAEGFLVKIGHLSLMKHLKYCAKD